MTYIEYCINWGKELASSQDYAIMNLIILILALWGCISILISIYKWLYKKKETAQ